MIMDELGREAKAGIATGIAVSARALRVCGGEVMRQAESANHIRLRTWHTWLGAVVVAVATASLAQVLLHRLFLELDVLHMDVVSGLLHAAIIAIPVILFVAWRSAAREEQVLQLRLRAAEAMRDDLTNMLVHDLKSPVISAGLALRSILRDIEAGECGGDHEAEMLEIARVSLARAEAMIGDILTVARAGSGKLELSLGEADLAALVRDQVVLASPRAEDDRLLLVGRIATEPIPARIDVSMMRRVLDNLIENAIKNTPSGGKIEVTVESVSGEAVVSVRDNGRGIPEELHGHIFEKYGQAAAARDRSATSVGLGLVLCKSVVEAHGGRIWVESVPGEGSTFSVAVPLGGAVED
jgi:signal transduction histidine kinase